MLNLQKEEFLNMIKESFELAALSYQSYFNLEEAACYIRCSTKTFKNLLRLHEVPHYQLGGGNRYRRIDLDKLIESRMKKKIVVTPLGNDKFKIDIPS